jgi:hypothetical protein
MLNAEAAILEFVRGRRSIESLAPFGITMALTSSGLVMQNRDGYLATAHPVDVAAGMLALMPDHEALVRWAGQLLAASPFLDLALDDMPYGEALLSGLWEVSCGSPVPEAAFLAAKELHVTP